MSEGSFEHRHRALAIRDALRQAQSAARGALIRLAAYASLSRNPSPLAFNAPLALVELAAAYFRLHPAGGASVVTYKKVRNPVDAVADSWP